MAQVNCIREMFFEKGMSYADIARTTGHDVKTVKKYIYMEDFNQPPPKPTENRGSKLDKYKSKIDDWLEADKQERKKQRHTAKRVYDRLKAMYSPDFDCSYRLVAAYVSQKKSFCTARRINSTCRLSISAVKPRWTSVRLTF